MTTLLIAVAIVIAFAALYWIDKREEDSITADISGYVFYARDGIQWNMSEAALRKNFPAIENGVSSNINNERHIYIKDSHANTEMIIYFIVAKANQDALKLLHFILSGMHEDDVNNLFKRLRYEYGEPVDNVGDNEEMGNVKWVNDTEAVILMNMKDKGYLLSFCEKNYYDESNQNLQSLLPLNVV